MNGYSSYKMSGVDWLGEIPQDWDLKRIKFLFEIRKRIAGKEGYTVLSITQKGIKVKDTDSGEGQIATDYSKYQFVEVGDFAMNHMDLLTGFIDISSVKGVTSPDYRVFSLTEKESNANYFLYLFQLCYTNRIFYALGQGSSQLGRWRLPSSQFNNFYVPFPSLLEQQAIADFLDCKTAQIDTLIAKKQRQIDLLQEQRMALINQVVTKGLNPSAPMKDSGVEWLGEIPSHWEMSKLKYLVTKIGSGVTPRGGAETYQESGIPFIRSQNVHFDGLRLDDIAYISEEVHSSMSNSAVRPNDVLINITGASIGRCTYIPSEFGEANVNQHVCVLRSNKKMNYQFLNLVLSSTIGQTQVWLGQGGAAREGLNYSNLGNFFIPLPPHDEQIDIIENVSKKLSQIDSVRKQVQELITKYQEYRTALISEAVTGKIDVRTAG